MRSFYSSLLNSHLSYGLPGWGTANKVDINKVASLQEKAIQVITKHFFFLIFFLSEYYECKQPNLTPKRKCCGPDPPFKLKLEIRVSIQISWENFNANRVFFGLLSLVGGW